MLDLQVENQTGQTDLVRMNPAKAREAASATRLVAAPRRRNYRHSNVRGKFSGSCSSPALKWASSASLRLGGAGASEFHLLTPQVPKHLHDRNRKVVRAS